MNGSKLIGKSVQKLNIYLVLVNPVNLEKPHCEINIFFSVISTLDFANMKGGLIITILISDDTWNQYQDF